MGPKNYGRIWLQGAGYIWPVAHFSNLCYDALHGFTDSFVIFKTDTRYT